jgi:hypothetical protein
LGGLHSRTKLFFKIKIHYLPSYPPFLLCQSSFSWRFADGGLVGDLLGLFDGDLVGALVGDLVGFLVGLIGLSVGDNVCKRILEVRQLFEKIG